MTLKDIELELIELRKEHEAMAEVVKHHIKNFDKLRNWHKLESQADIKNKMEYTKAKKIAGQYAKSKCKEQKEIYIERARKLEVKPIDTILIEMVVCEIERRIATEER